MKPQEFVVHAVVTTKDKKQKKTSLNIIHLAGINQNTRNSAINHLREINPNAEKIEIIDVEWVVDRTPE